MLWHVDDMKVSHKNKEEVTKFIEYMKEIYGEEMPVARGKKNTYVGMGLNYSSPGEVILSIYSYITEAIDKLPEEMMKTMKTPAGNHLFKVDDACEKLCERDKIIFHRLVAKLLFISKRAPTDIKPTIAFLTTRVRNPDKDDWKNPQRVLSSLETTINSLNIHLNANYLNVVH